MAFPVPVPGLVIRYAYLWRREHERGQEEGAKDRPCAVLLSVGDAAFGQTVIVLPITHTPPRHDAEAVEIPAATKRRLGLDDERSWIVLTEANRFTCRGLTYGRSGRAMPRASPMASYPVICSGASVIDGWPCRPCGAVLWCFVLNSMARTYTDYRNEKWRTHQRSPSEN